ncbi:MAG: hypothetical protein FWG55_01310 [Candidatus Bathyarchaeota archaeon]|nr:hypothetical protein [Candidatus Termiticorpusculum sp.]
MDNKTMGLSIVCVVLAMLLVFSFVNNSTVPTGNDSEIKKLKDDNQRLQGTINSLQDDNQRLQNSINSLQGTVQELRDIINLGKSTTIANGQTINQQAGQYNSWTVNAQYAGYIFVRIDSSTTNQNFARVSYTSNGGQGSHTITYNQRVDISSSGGWTCFPVLPGTVTVYIGNSNLINGATMTVTAEYWY